MDVVTLADGRIVHVTLVDAGVPVAFVTADDLGVRGWSLPSAIDRDRDLLAALEEVRGTAARWMGFVDDWHDAATQTPGVPKVVMVSPPETYVTTEGFTVTDDQVDVQARQISMGRAHQSYAVTGAIATTAAAFVDGTVVHRVARSAEERPVREEVRIGQPYGAMLVSARLGAGQGNVAMESATVARTARHIMRGSVQVRPHPAAAQHGM